MSRRKPKRKIVRLLDLPREVCRCGAEFVIEGGCFPLHQLGDQPAWMEPQECGLSGKPVRRRQPKRKKWWSKYGRKP